MEASKRIRLLFRDDDILSETQKSDGLDRSWVLLKPGQHDTVSDVAAHLLDAFHLHQSCPHGVLLSISGFALPPFEAACILKDEEIISVRKRRQVLSIEGNNVGNEVVKLKAAEKQPVNSGVLLLANEEFEKEKGGYEGDDNEEADEEEPLADSESLLDGDEEPKYRKRKPVEKLQGSKKKKQRTEASEFAANKVQTGNTGNSLQERGRTEKDSMSCEEKKDDSDNDDKVENDGDSAKSSEKNNASVAGMKRNDKENRKEYEDPKTAAKDNKKGPSRSARRKYAKRRWLKEMKKIQKQNMNCESEGLRNWKEDQAKAKRNKAEKGQQKWKKHQADAEINDDGQPKGLLHWVQSPQDNKFVKGKKRGRQNQNAYFSVQPNQKIDVNKQQNRKSNEHEQPTQNSEGLEQPTKKVGDVPQQQIRKNCVEEDPNKINDTSMQPNEESDEENEVVPIEIRPGHIRFEPLGKEAEQTVQENHAPLETFQWNGITSKKKGQQWGKENHSFSPRNNVKDSSKVYSEILGNEKDKQLDAGIDFDKLPPFTSMPKEGDLIAYRILELSSSWTPELSAFRVGKVSWYNAETNQTLLVPVPEYPVCSKKANEDEAEEPFNSLYKEDGSLEIDFSSLIDARIINNSGSGLGNEAHNRVSECVGGSEDTSKTVLPSSHDQLTVSSNPATVEQNLGKETEVPTSGIGGTDIWDQISEALNAKKEFLAKENGWGKTPKKLQPVQENKWGGNAKNVKPSPERSWGKNAQKVQPSQDGFAKQSSGSKSWSYKALRGSALGPTMAMLRSRKDV